MSTKRSRTPVFRYFLCAAAFSAATAYADPIQPVRIDTCLAEAAKAPSYSIVIPTTAAANPIKPILCSKGGTYFRLDGVADFQKTAELLKPYGLSPLQVTHPQFGPLAFWQIWGANHPSINVGEGGAMSAYDEVIFSVAAKPSAEPMEVGGVLGQLFQAPMPETFGLFVAKIWVTTDIAVAAGNEIWGFNKTKADIHFAPSADRVVLDLKENGQPVFALDVAAPTGPSPSFVNFYTYTRHTRAAGTLTAADGPFSGKASVYDPAQGDKLEFAKTGWGAKLAELGFQAAGSQLPNKTLLRAADLKFEGPQPLR
jgi:hypothetical protein